MRIDASVRRVLARCPSFIAKRILERAATAKSPNDYVVASVLNWEIDRQRARVVSQKREQEWRFALDDQAELATWDQTCREKSLKVLGASNSINAITLALWIEDGASGTAFARKEGISRDCLYQRKLRARLEVLSQLDAQTAAYLYEYGMQRSSIRRGDTRRKKTVRAPVGACAG